MPNWEPLRFFKSKIFSYILNKYLVYAIQFISSFFLAKYLGVFFFGIYGFIQIMLQYLSYSNIGVNYSFNLILSVNEYAKFDKEKVWSVSVFLTALVSLILIAGSAAFYSFHIAIFDKFHFLDYIFLLMAIVIFRHIGSLYTNLCRIYGNLNKINYFTALPALGIFVCVFFFKGESLFYAILYAQIIAYICGIIIFAVKSPLKFVFDFPREIINVVIKKGIFLLLYNLSFYLMMLASRTLVGIFFAIEDLGYFTFAYSLMFAVLMLIDSLNFVFYAKILNKFSGLTEKSAILDLLNKLRSIYIFAINLTGLFSFLFLPLLVVFLPEYSASLSAFKFLMIAQIIINNNFGYATLLISRGMEKKLIWIGFLSIFSIILSGIFFAGILKLSYNYIALATVIGATIYSILTIGEGNKLLNQNKTFRELITEIFPLKYVISYAIVIFSVIFKIYPDYAAALAFILFVLLNYADLYSLKNNINKIMNYKIEVLQ